MIKLKKRKIENRPKSLIDNSNINCPLFTMEDNLSVIIHLTFSIASSYPFQKHPFPIKQKSYLSCSNIS